MPLTNLRPLELVCYHTAWISTSSVAWRDLSSGIRLFVENVRESLAIETPGE